jgi:hypothetical protein
VAPFEIFELQSIPIEGHGDGKQDSAVRTITKPKPNAPLTAAQINDLTVIAHHEVALV